MRQNSAGAPAPVVAPPDPDTTVKAFVSVSPFSYAALDATMQGPPAEEVQGLLAAHFSRPHVLVNSGRHALDLILTELAPRPDDVVTIVTTSGSSYVSSCVTSTVERYCRWSMQRESGTVAVIAIHEWGRACERISDHLGTGVPVIEDCAYAFATRYADGEPVGRRGDYALFSLTKMFSVNFGGAVVFPAGRRPAFVMPEDDRAFLLSAIGSEMVRLNALLEMRRDVWNDLATRFAAIGVKPFFAPVSGEQPSVFMFAHDPSTVPLPELRHRFDAHGIEGSVFYGSDAFFIPAHHRVGPRTRELMVKIYAKLMAEQGAHA
ncbi:dTDP-4-amino-4,6-dideoxygalactose transaminase [Sphingomonas gellani]|uniref:dTDP-4-amino-4,6-dideoxygalactose transaminase n=1 Tax=Sphingomonas gellani TaxID=1166340 RepID=A0A1H8I5D6_9SPHN|nr:DegT/DnrJ/EryC1/StrS family aminotransferase [Sphingomonas gellani]SEN63038.1 dTDP-4-amino-4,6-dideoxygalactose transaminase [Sphingomonas gellani]